MCVCVRTFTHPVLLMICIIRTPIDSICLWMCSFFAERTLCTHNHNERNEQRVHAKNGHNNNNGNCAVVDSRILFTWLSLLSVCASQCVLTTKGVWIKSLCSPKCEIYQKQQIQMYTGCRGFCVPSIPNFNPYCTPFDTAVDIRWERW